MSKCLPFLIWSWTILLSGCKAEIAAPNREDSSASLAARANAASLSTYTTSNERIHLSWVDDVRNEVGWEVHRSTTGATGSFALLASLGTNSTGYTDAGLAAKTQYCYKVRSLKRQGSNIAYAAFTNVSCNTTLGPPTGPTGFTAVPRNSQTVDLAWTDSANDEQGFRIELAYEPAGPWQTIATVGTNVSSSSNQNASFTERHVCYRAVAFNAWGGSASNVDCTVPPRAPSNVSAASNAQSIDLTWVDASNNEDGYEIQRAPSNGLWQIVANVASNATSFADATIVAEETYQYRVRAKRDGGFSDISSSNRVSLATRIPESPVLQSASPGGSTVAVLTFTNVSTVASELRVERSSDGRLTWVTAATLPPGYAEIHDRDRTAELEICYRVIARNALGDSPPSNVDCTIPPARPTNVTETRGDGESWPSGTVTWTDNSNIEQGYEVVTEFCHLGWSCSGPQSTMYPPNTTSIELGFDGWERQEYLWAVYAIYEGGRSDIGTSGASAASAVTSAEGAARHTGRIQVPSQSMRAPNPRATRSALPMRKSP